ncbi:MAG: DUF4272 domain-containing protein [Saprospiraceae bacterium]|nr:DUF4272 domain-containing protein [Saprospiraceae bacterium]
MHKTAIERKQFTEGMLIDLGIPYIGHLPAIEEESETQLRSPQEIAKRILVLTYLGYIGEVEEDKSNVVDFLKSENLWSSASPIEQRQFLSKEMFNPQELIDISWRSECVWILLWAIKKYDKIDLPTVEVSIEDILDFLPDFMSSTEEFIENSVLREKSEILDQSDLLYRLHWAVRNCDNEKMSLNPGVVRERHYAINWLTYYEQLEWDDITTDT